MDFRRLSYFALMCQGQGLAATASALGISPSALSAAMKNLSEEVGTPLFEQVRRRSHLTPAGVWLYRSVVPLLHAEEFYSNWTSRGDQATEPVNLIVDIPASFALGRLARAVSRAVQLFRESHPNTFVRVRFSDALELGPLRESKDPSPEPTTPSLAIEARPLIAERACDPAGCVTVLAEDQWVEMRTDRAFQPDQPGNDNHGPYLVPGLDAELFEQVRLALENRPNGSIKNVEEPATMLARLTWQYPSHAFVVPMSVGPDKRGLENVDVRPVDPPLACQLIGRHAPADEEARSLAGIIRDLLLAPDQLVQFRPALSFRQMQCIQALFECRSISAAARSLSIAQPALTSILQKLERMLNCQCFVRSRDGILATGAGERVNRAANELIAQVRTISILSATVTSTEGGTLKIGVVSPEVHTSLTAQCIARAIGAWRQRYPSTRLQVVQGSSTSLQGMVNSGAIGLAISEHTAPGMSRFKLAEREALAVVANPRFSVLPPGPVRLADLVNLPLVLPTQGDGIRQILDAAAAEAHLKLVPAVEVNSLPLMLAMLREQPLCSVLSESAVRNQINCGALRSHAIIEPGLARQFYAFYSGHRDLSKAEREFLYALRLEFVRAGGSIGLATVNVA